MVATGNPYRRLAGDLGLDEQDLLAALQRELIESTAEILGRNEELDSFGRLGGRIGIVGARTRGHGH